MDTQRKLNMIKTPYASRLTFAFLFAIAIALTACGPRDAATLTKIVAADYPKVDGSTAEDPLTRLVACTILDVSCSWTTVTADNIERSILPDPSATGEDVDTINAIARSGTHGAYEALVAGEADLIIVARKPSADENDLASKAGVGYDYQPIGIDAFVFMANIANPVDNITTDQIFKVYTGEITEWAELGVTVEGDDKTIHAYQRNPNSGSQELMDEMILKGKSMIEAPELVTTSMMGPFNMIGGNPFTGEGDELGLGYTVYFYATAMFPHQYVKLISINGVPPNAATLASREYPLTADVYVVIRRGMPANSTAVALRDWLLTEEGQKVVAESGYIPISD
jgi:phosphate transport system substrate-binding protein